MWRTKTAAKRMESVYSKRIRAGKRRTYFFGDVRAFTRSNDYYLTITESRKKFNEDGYDRHKIFLYKEDFNKFLKALTEAARLHVKTELMPCLILISTPTTMIMFPKAIGMVSQENGNGNIR